MTADLLLSYDGRWEAFGIVELEAVRDDLVEAPRDRGGRPDSEIPSERRTLKKKPKVLPSPPALLMPISPPWSWQTGGY
jgi:hypothetical protein